MEVGADCDLILGIAAAEREAVQILSLNRDVFGDRELDAAAEQDVIFFRSTQVEPITTGCIDQHIIGDDKTGAAQDLAIAGIADATGQTCTATSAPSR